MSIQKKCDICRKTIDLGFSINVSLQCEKDFINVSEYISEIGNKDICTECYYKIKNLTNQ